MKSLAKLALLALPALIFASSCAKEGPEQGSYKAGKNSITLIVGNDEAATKAGVVCQEKQIASYPLFEEGDETELVMVETVSQMDDAACEPATKGTPIFTENFDTLYGGDFYGTAFDASVTSGKLTDVWGSYLENNGTVPFKKVADHTYSYEYSKGQAINLGWPESNSLRFFLQAPYSVIKNNLKITPEFYGDGSIKFSYTDPNTPASGVITNGSLNQTDILFTSKVVNGPSDPTDGVSANILMYHSLTAVKFKVGTPDEGANVGLPIITKVTIKNIKTSGDCTITPNYTDANTSAGNNPSNHNQNNNTTNVTKSWKCAQWKNQANPVNYVETFTADQQDAGYAEGAFGQSFYEEDTELKNLGNADGSKILLLIPQSTDGITNTGDEIEFEVEYKMTDGGNTYHRSVKVDINWLAGEIHTYTFTINKVDVKVDDQVSGLNKTEVTTTNTGNVTAYLRASCVLAWFYGNTVVAPYTGTFNPTLGANWVKVGDYYYYKKAIQPGKATKNMLFESWSAPGENNSGFPEAHLEMKILLQGVQYDSAKAKATAAWGNAAADKLTTEIEK